MNGVDDMNIKKLLESEKSIFSVYKNEIESLNIKLFRTLLMIVGAVTLSMSVLSSVVSSFDMLRIPYYILFVVSLILGVLFYQNLRGIPVVYLFYLFYTCIFIFVTYTGYTIFPDGESTLVLGFIFIYATMFYDNTKRIFTVAIIYATVYSICALLFKSSNAMALDMVNVWGYTIVINIIGFTFRLTQLENIKLKETLKQQAITDSLTKLKNRTALNEFLSDDSKIQSISSVVMMDIDYFKGYNDFYGHLARDHCLVALANIFLSMEKNNPMMYFYRYGGEEILLVFEDSEFETVIEKVKEIQVIISELNIPHENSPHHVVTVSYGIAKVNPSQPVFSFIELADEALYRSKKDGRNRINIVE